MWRDLELDPDSLENLEDFPRPTAMLQAKQRMAENKSPCHPVTSRGVKGSHALREVDAHIATGDPNAADMGRIYSVTCQTGASLS